MNLRKTLCNIVLTGVLALGINNSKANADWKVIYEEDFSKDPAWTTNDPAHCNWNEAEQTYHAWMPNTNTNYAYKNVDWDGDSFKLQWDLKMNNCQWSAGQTFGIFDKQLLYYSKAIVGDIGIADGGHYTTLYADDGTNNVGSGAYSPSWQQGIWYRNQLTYDKSKNLVEMSIIERDSGNPFMDLEVNCGPFPEDIDYVGMSRLHMQGYNHSAADFDIDNVKFSIPEPMTLSLLALGAGILGSRKKYK